MATDKLINSTQGDDIVTKLNLIATKIQAINHDVTIPSNQVTAMTGYSEPSSTSAIVVGDTLNQAIGKLEKKADNNQSNISMLEQLGVAKNYAQLTYTGSTVNNVTYTVSNGVISTNGNTTNASTNITITGEIPLSAGDYVLLDGLTTSSAQINLTLRINNVWKGTTATGGKYEFTVEQGDTVHIELIVANNQSTAGVVFKPMIISKAVYDAGFTDFQPYTMSLSDITAWILAQS